MSAKLEKGNRVGLVCCSNGLSESRRGEMEKLEETLLKLGLVPEKSRCMHAGSTVFCGTGEERAAELMRFYEDPGIRAIFDVSGGDTANGILPYLDFESIKKADKLFWGYSDLTCIINAIYARTGRPSVLYQIRNLVGEDGERQTRAFSDSVMGDGNSLFTFPYTFLQGDHMEGTAAGGNIRCLLKLAGTKFWPDMRGKILVLESSGGEVPQMASFLCQLKLMGVFEEISGILLGTFLAMEKGRCRPSMEELVLEAAGKEIPVAKTARIGHRADSRAVIIGEKLSLRALAE